jgi:hypothetical protein
MITKLKESLRALWSDKKADRKPSIAKDILYFSTGASLKRGHENVPTNWVCEGSVGWELGLRPKFLHLSLNYWFSEEELKRFVPADLLTEADSSWLKRAKGEDYKPVYKLLPSPFLPPVVVEQLWQAVKTATGIKEVDLLPPHPSWVYEEGLGINFCIRRVGTPSFVDLLGKRRDIFYRSGKDLWKVPLFVKRRVKVLVIEAREGHDDGNMWVKSEKSFMYLARGIVKVNGNPLFLKGRVIGTPTLPGGEEWPEGDYNIVTSGHNVKWGTIAPGTILEMDVQFVSKENHDQEDKEVVEKRKLTILAKLAGMVKFDPEHRDWIDTSFRRNAMKVAKLLKEYSSSSIEELKSILEEDPRSLIALDQALKARLGLVSEETLVEIYEAQMEKLRSARIPGQWLSAIARDTVPTGTIWLSAHDRVDFFQGEVTVIRYPITSHQSFLTLKAEYRDDLIPGLVTISGQDAKYLALDGDDHVLVTSPFSAFRGGEEVLSGRSGQKLDLGALSFAELYISPANAQGMIGYCFNAMAACLGFRELCLSSGHAEKAKELEGIASRLGMLLDVLAQAIKKPYALDTEAIKIASVFQRMAERNPVAALCLRKEMRESASKVWNVDIPYLKPAKVFDQGLAKLPEDIIKMMSEGLKRAASARNGHQEYTLLTSLSRKLLDWVKNHPDLEEAAAVYYTVAVYLYKKRSHLMIGLMDGSLLYLGRKVCEQRYSPLFQSQ